ncbi:hypothetical protein [Mucilaginibacter sp. CSA2-8R]|uniref:hypothetical protein n=1 Tax=Mucilaginibacter sp. CSA2-8R TaxID=3141542 RepID=UPI00315C8A9D
MKKIDLITPFQQKSIAAIDGAYFRERTASGECVFEVGVWSHCVLMIFEQCPDYKALPEESFVYRFCWHWLHHSKYLGNYIEGEVEIDRLPEFYNYLQNIRHSPEIQRMAAEEMDVILEICKLAMANGNRLFLIADY